MRLVFIVLALFACSVSILLAESSPDDPALSKTLTLAIKGEALSDVMTTLSSKTGVRFTVSKRLADRKVTVFVDDKKLSIVMNGLSSLLNCKWADKTSNGVTSYELVRDSKDALTQEKEQKSIESKIWHDLQVQLDVNAQLSEKTPEELQKLAEEAKAAMSTATDAEVRSKWSLYVNATDCADPFFAPCMSFLRSLSPKLLASFTPGTELDFDSSSDDPAWKLPDSLVKTLLGCYPALTDKMRRNHAGGTSPGAFISEKSVFTVHAASDSVTNVESAAAPAISGDIPNGVGVRFVKESGDQESTIKAYICFRRPEKEPQPVEGAASPDMPGVVCISPTLTEVFASGHTVCLARRSVQQDFEEKCDPLPSDENSKLLDQTVSITSAELKNDVMSGPAAKINRSDILAVLHSKYKLQIMADHYSRWMRYADVKDKPVAEALESFKMDGLEGFKTYCGQDDSLVYVRTRASSGTMPESETANRVLKPWQEAVSTYGCLELDELADVACLSDKQVNVIREGCEYLGLGSLQEFL